MANRGEIAARIRRTAEGRGMTVVIPATDGVGAVNLLDGSEVVKAARAAGADALHPGYGFLAEDPRFAELVVAAGIGWVGPPASAIRAMGDKAAARRLARHLGIPVARGYDAAGQSDEALGRAARRIGFPLLVKPAAGGGGKGMRIVRAGNDLPDSLAAARREAGAAFGDDRLILENYLDGARHVEVQVLFDQHGSGIHLGERDCSVQRRHQKVLEESPSPAVGEELRGRLGAMALRLAGAVGYVSAGTCEFLVDEGGASTFLEMNARLQVEHAVTELVADRDLVADQLRIAAGEPLGVTQAEADAALRRGGHAVEVRVYAEDAENGFLPATGTVEFVRWPVGEGIRVDAGIEAGSEVTGRFDPMLAKIIAHGRDRAGALERLTAALDETVILGLTTNVRFLRWLVGEGAVRDGLVKTDTLERIWPPADLAVRTAIPEAAWRAAAQALAGQAGWRLNAPARVRLAAETTERAVDVPTQPLAPPEHESGIVVHGPIVHVDVGGRSIAFRVASPPDVDRAARAATAGAGGPVELTAPMPGLVRAVHVAAGAAVAAGDVVATIEAMKMEHAVRAPIAGRLTDLAIRPGEQVVRGQPIGTVEP